MQADLAYAASYLPFRHAAYVHRCLRAVRPAGGRRLVTILTACQPGPAPPFPAFDSDNLPF